MTIVEFLAARLDEDEAAARRLAGAVWPTEVRVAPRTDTGEGEPEGCVAVAAAGPKAWRRTWRSGAADDGWALHEDAVEVWSPRLGQRMLAEVAAKRAILDFFGRDCEDSGWYYEDKVVSHLAAVYADHPDYREDWRP